MKGLRRIAVLILFVHAGFISYFANASNENAVICQDCNYQQAKAIAMENTLPQLHCQIVSGSDVINVDKQSCYSDAKKIVVFNATTRTAFPFEVYHSNQGANPHDMVIQARDRNIAPQIIELLNVGVDMQTNLNNSVHELAAAAIAKFPQVAAASGSALPAMSASYSASSSEDCSSDRDSAALETALSESTRAGMQQYVQEIHRAQIAHTIDAFMSYFQRNTASLSTVSFNLSKNSYGVNASFVIAPKTTHFTAIYNTASDIRFYDTKGQSGWVGYPQLVYDIGPNQKGDVTVTVNENYSYIDGKTLAAIRNYQNSSEPIQISPCLALKLQQLNPNIQFDAPIPIGGSDGRGNGKGGFAGVSWCTMYGKVNGKIVLVMRVMC